MELNDYQERAMRTRLPESDNFCYMIFGLVEEVGELAGKISKNIRKDLANVNDNELYVVEEEKAAIEDAVRKELGDVMWMVAGLADELGWKLDDVCLDNLQKLADRANRGKIDGSGDNR